MAVIKDQQALVKKLKKQILILQKKEEQNRTKLRAAIKKTRKLGNTYRIKLARKMCQLKTKLAEEHVHAHAKMAASIEKQLLKTTINKAKLLAATITQLEKQQIVKLIRALNRIKKPKAKHK